MEKINNSWLGEKLNTTLPQKIASKWQIKKLEKPYISQVKMKNGKLPKNWFGEKLDTTLPLKIAIN